MDNDKKILENIREEIEAQYRDNRSIYLLRGFHNIEIVLDAIDYYLDMYPVGSRKVPGDNIADNINSLFNSLDELKFNELKED